MRSFPRRLRFVTALALVLYWGGMHVAPAFAGLAPSRPSGVTTIASARDADMIAVQRMLENKIVVQKLRDYGVTPDQARLRAANLSDAELHQLASASKGLPSGGDGTGAVISILIIILLVILILKLLNKDVVIR